MTSSGTTQFVAAAAAAMHAWITQDCRGFEARFLGTEGPEDPEAERLILYGIRCAVPEASCHFGGGSTCLRKGRSREAGNGGC